MKAKEKVLLEYFWGRESVYALAINDQNVFFRRMGSSDTIGLITNKLLLHLTDAHASMSPQSFALFTENAHRLYQILVEPFKDLLNGRRRIQVIPDGSISQVPFEILLEGSPPGKEVDYRSLPYLIKSYTISYAYSSFMLRRQNKKSQVSSPSLLAVGFTGGQQYPGVASDHAVITGVEEELKSLEKRFSSGKFLVGDEATETNFKAYAPDFDILHLAVHGMGDVKRNLAASLYFGKKNDKEDGELHAYELYGLKLKALMAVLSACESGVGKGYRGEGMISMASAFIYSGCENILMSLWKVNDQVSIQLMDDFYQQLLDGQSIDEALRLAKLHYIETSDELSADPKIWAPLVAYGNLEQIFQKGRSWIFLLGGIVTLLLILLLSRKVYKRV